MNSRVKLLLFMVEMTDLGPWLMEFPQLILIHCHQKTESFFKVQRIMILSLIFLASAILMVMELMTLLSAEQVPI